MAGLRVVHVIGGGEFGGAERYVLDLVTRLDPAAFETLVACGYEGRLARALRAAGRPVVVLPRGPAGLRALLARLRAAPAAIVHTHGVRGNFFGRLAAWRARVPAVVTTVHSDFRRDYPQLRKRLPYRVLEAATSPLVTRYVAVSRALKNLLVGRGIPPERVEVIPNGVDTDAFRPLPEAGRRLRAQLQVDEGTRLVGMVARLHPVKGHPLFLRAAAVAAAAAPAVRFLVVGGGEPAYRRQLEALAAGLGLASRVAFLGEREDVAAVLAGLDAVVVPSRYEGFSLAVAEAMACGVPVVATAVGGIPELVADGVNGLLVPPEDPAALAAAVLRLLRDPELAARLAVAGRATAERHSVGAFVARTAALYRSLVPAA